jgi:hypothetical protein
MANDHTLSIYDGRTLIGIVIGAEKQWQALDAHGNPLPGAFKSRKAAVAAVNSPSYVHCVRDCSGERGGGGGGI